MWGEFRSQVLTNPVGVEPTNPVKGSPKLGGLVDIDLACLLRIRLAELLVVAEAEESSLKDASLAGQVRSAVQSQVASERHLVGVQEVDMRVVAQVNRLSLPIHLEAVGSVGQRVQRRTVVGKRPKVLVLTVGGHDPTRGLRRGTNTWSRSNGAGGGCAGVGTDRSRGGLGLLDPVAARSGWLGGSRLSGRQDGMVSLGMGAAVSLEECSLLEKPCLSVGRVVLHDLRSESEGELVLFALGWDHSGERGRRSGANMVVDNAAVVFEFGGSKERSLSRAGRDFLGRVENGVLDLVRRSGGSLGRRHRFAVRRDGRRHWHWVLARVVRSRRLADVGVMTVVEAIVNLVRRRHQAAEVVLLGGH